MYFFIFFSLVKIFLDPTEFFPQICEVFGCQLLSTIYFSLFLWLCCIDTFILDGRCSLESWVWGREGGPKIALDRIPYDAGNSKKCVTSYSILLGNREFTPIMNFHLLV